MSWTDKGAIKHILAIRDIFKIKTLVETGTFKGINAELHSKNFENVMTCEKIKDYFYAAYERLKSYNNVCIMRQDSKEFLKMFDKKELIMFYLDAHFYDPKAKNKWVVLDELKSLEGRKNSIIIVHDFDNNLGHITYEGQPLNLKLMKKLLLKVNPNFKFYTNELSSCEPVTLNKQDIISARLKYDDETLDNLNYAWTKPRLTYRGILYCLPKKVNIDGLRLIE